MTRRDLDDTDRALINGLQGGFPIEDRPFRAVGDRFGLSEEETIARIRRLVEDGSLSRFGPLFDAERIGGAVTLAAMAVPASEFERVAAAVNGFSEVAHNYARDHQLNMWFVVSSDDPSRIAHVIAEIEAAVGLPVHDMPKQEEFYVGLRLTA